ncbi:MAG: hypothetical protein HYY68_06600 [Thaumarchaeota archaeon]|nr:hypothetical protein [Nitrososphaerota archaeon]
MQLKEPVTILDENKTGQGDSSQETETVVGFQVESTIDKVRVARLALGHGKVPRPSFDLGADLKELSREGNKLTVKYTLYLDTFPAVQRVELQGVATIRSPLISSQTNDVDVSETLLSEVALEIFRNHYDIMYLLFDSMRLPFPSPWVVKNVHLV